MIPKDDQLTLDEKFVEVKPKDQADSEDPKMDKHLLNFSGVTSILDETLAAINKEKEKAMPTHMSTQLKISEEGFDHFSAHLIKRAENMQIKTGKKLWSYLKKETTFSNQQI